MVWGSTQIFIYLIIYFVRFCALKDHPDDLQENSHGIIKPTDCPAGYYCLSGTKAYNQYPCPVGTYSNETGLRNQGECKPCPGGTFCSSAGRDHVWIKYSPGCVVPRRVKKFHWWMNFPSVCSLYDFQVVFSISFVRKYGDCRSSS